jgi:hypothetical protein
MLTYVVMPRLDEADLIEGAIASLGFGGDAAPPDAHFVAVDNGSSDGTLGSSRGSAIATRRGSTSSTRANGASCHRAIAAWRRRASRRAPKVGCRWCNRPAEYGPATTVYNRFNRWSHRGFWLKLLDAQIDAGAVTKSTALDSTYVKAQHAAFGAKGGARHKRSARAAAGRPRSTRSPTLSAVPMR